MSARGVSADRADHGGGSALAVGAIAVVVALTTSILPFVALVPLHARAAAAADLAALAAADTASLRVPGDPCIRAAEAAALHRADVVSCVVDGDTTDVEVRIVVGGLVLAASARAGPPP